MYNLNNIFTNYDKFTLKNYNKFDFINREDDELLLSSAIETYSKNNQESFFDERLPNLFDKIADVSEETRHQCRAVRNYIFLENILNKTKKGDIDEERFSETIDNLIFSLLCNMYVRCISLVEWCFKKHMFSSGVLDPIDNSYSIGNLTFGKVIGVLEEESLLSQRSLKVLSQANNVRNLIVHQNFIPERDMMIDVGGKTIEFKSDHDAIFSMSDLPSIIIGLKKPIDDFYRNVVFENDHRWIN